MVYRAYDQRLERDVALKVLPPSPLDPEIRRKRLRKEALTLSRLNHPHIAHVYDVDSQDGTDFLVMEFVHGMTLADMLKDGPIPERQLISYGQQIAATLADAHQEGIVHCDIKPANVMVDARGRIKILDFGLAQVLRIGDLDPTQSLQNQFCGTLPYMAPEQLAGNSRDPRSDVYAVGVTLYELATGQRPFDHPSPITLADEIRHRVPAPLQKVRPEISTNFQNVVLHCLEKDANRRYQNAREVADGLAALASGSAPVLPRTRGISRAWWIASAGVLLLLVAAAAILLRFKSPPPSGGERELVILPISDQVPAADAAFGNGLLETLGSRLARLGSDHALQIVPVSEMRRQKISTLQEAREQFGVNLGLEVTLQHAGDMMRVDYALIDAKVHRQVNGDTITAPASDTFGLEDKVADSVVRTLGLQLRPEERQVLTEQSTRQPAAYDYYLQGRGYLQEFYKPENVESAITEFNSAIAQDHDYALAYAGLGEAFWRKEQLTGKPEWVEKARSACEHAVSLRADQAAGHSCLGLIMVGTGHYEEAADQYKRAIDIDPSDDRNFAGLGGVYERLGKLDLAEGTLLHAINLRGQDWAAYNALGQFYNDHARYADAIHMFSQVVALIPDSYAGYSNLGAAYVGQGDYTKAVATLKQSIAIRQTSENLSNLATAYLQLRRFSEAARTYESAVKLQPTNYEVWGNLGDAYYWAPGERLKSLDAYRRAIDFGRERIKINPRDASLLSYLAQDCAMIGDRTAATDYINRALALAPKDPDLLETAGLVFNQFGEQDKALGYLDQAVAAGYVGSTLHDVPNFDNLRDLPRFQKLAGPVDSAK